MPTDDNTILYKEGPVDAYAWYDYQGNRHLIFSMRDWSLVYRRLLCQYIISKR